MKKNRSLFKKLLKILLVIVFVISAYALIINAVVVHSTKEKIISENEMVSFHGDAALLLGCGVYEDGTLSPMLEERCLGAASLYKNKIVKKIIASGDNGTYTYDEVNPMKNFLISQGVPSEDIFMDHAGFCTYDSVYRAKAIFGCEKVIIVTQKYHLYRALYIAENLGLEAVGLDATRVIYGGQVFRDLREVLARNKDFVLSHLETKPTLLGDPIPITSDADITNDK